MIWLYHPCWLNTVDILIMVSVRCKLDVCPWRIQKILWHVTCANPFFGPALFLLVFRNFHKNKLPYLRPLNPKSWKHKVEVTASMASVFSHPLVTETWLFSDVQCKIWAWAFTSPLAQNMLKQSLLNRVCNQLFLTKHVADFERLTWIVAIPSSALV